MEADVRGKFGHDFHQHHDRYTPRFNGTDSNQWTSDLIPVMTLGQSSVIKSTSMLQDGGLPSMPCNGGPGGAGGIPTPNNTVSSPNQHDLRDDLGQGVNMNGTQGQNFPDPFSENNKTCRLL
nr:hypothetical protein BaRGS_010077 [Batillaria attramentaria]